VRSTPGDEYNEAVHFLVGHSTPLQRFQSTVLLLMSEMARGKESPFAAYTE